jgi:hypothetical protein
MDATYLEGTDKSPYLDLDTTFDDFELDATKVCLITDPDCESCQ